MTPTQIQMQIPLEWNVRKVYPMAHQVVNQPNDLLSEILENDSLPARKVFYIVLAKNHVAQQDTLTYIVPFTDVYKSKKNARQRGLNLQSDIRKAFQHTSFAVDKEFVRIELGGSANVPYISPFSMVDFIQGCFHITLSLPFKKYLQYLARLKKGWTMGDLKLLLSMNHRATDKMYWFIRSKQFYKGTHKVNLEELKFTLGYSNTSNKNFCSQTLAAVEKELRGTWAEFTFVKLTKGREIREVKFFFDKDEVVMTKLRHDLKYEYEIELFKRGVWPVMIHNIRHLILNQEAIIKDGKRYTWSWHYVLWTIRFVDNQHSNGKLKDKAGFLKTALFEGYYAQQASEMPFEYPGAEHLPLGRCLKAGVSINVKNAYPETFLTEYAATKSMTADEYIDHLKIHNNITLIKYINPVDNGVWFLDSVYVKRLRVLENKSALEKQILVQN